MKEEVLHGISLDIRSGATVALVGESGSGKSVTALSVLKLLETAVISGEAWFEGKNLLNFTEAEMREIRGNRIAMIFQEPMTSLNPVYSIGSQLCEPLMLHQGLTDSEARRRAIELLERTGISNPEERIDSFPHQLSGGQRQRVMIAMALACRPSLLIADEPTTALDVTIQAQILELISDLQREMDMAVLLITHDLSMVKKTADYVYIMRDGMIVEDGQTNALFAGPRDEYTIHLLNSVPRGTAEPKTPSSPLIRVNDLKCHFPIKAGFFKRTIGMIKAVDGVDLNINEGTTFGVVGESGSGKTTLGMAILGLTASRGSISYNNIELGSIKKKEWRRLRSDLQVVFQDPFSSLSPRRTVGPSVGEGLSVHQPELNSANRRTRVDEALFEVGLAPHMADRYPHEFSGGQRQRIAIARAVILKPRFIVLDEPTSALDMTIQAQIIDLLRDLQTKHNITYLFISHDLRVVRALADDIAVMQNGRVVESGPASVVFSKPSHPYTQKLFAAAIELVQ